MKLRFILCITIIAFYHCSKGQIYSGEDKSRYQTALEKYQENNYRICIDICTEMLEGNKRGTWEVYLLRALAFSELGEYERSEIDFTEAMQSGNKRDPNLYFERGRLRMKMKKFDKAEFDFTYAQRILKDQISPDIELFPILEELGHSQQYGGNYKSAITSYVKAIDNGSTHAYIDLLSSYLQSDNLIDLNYISDTLLKTEHYILKSDSSIFRYLEVLNNISRYVRKEDDIVKINIQLKNTDDIDMINDIYKSFFSGDLPARTVIGVAEIPMNALVQIDAVVSNAEGTPA